MFDEGPVANIKNERHNSEVAKSATTKFSVQSENEAAAIAYLEERGYPPKSIEHDREGLVVLVFAPLPDDQMYGLAQALPIHLSAKIGVVMGDRLPFVPVDMNGN